MARYRCNKALRIAAASPCSFPRKNGRRTRASTIRRWACRGRRRNFSTSSPHNYSPACTRLMRRYVRASSTSRREPFTCRKSRVNRDPKARGVSPKRCSIPLARFSFRIFCWKSIAIPISTGNCSVARPRRNAICWHSMGRWHVCLLGHDRARSVTASMDGAHRPPPTYPCHRQLCPCSRSIGH